MENISRMTLQVLERLEALRVEHVSLMKGMGDGHGDIKKFGIIKKSIENIELGLCEAQSMMSLASQFRDLEAENHRLRGQANILQQENAWLRDELGQIQQKLRKSGKKNSSQHNAQCKEDLRNTTKSKATPKKSDNCKQQNTKDNSKAPYRRTLPEKVTIKRHNLSSKRSSLCDNREPSTGYEIPARLRTLNDLVVRYAAQGRFEVVVPLCKQALEDLEKTNGHDHPDVATMLNILALVYRDQKNFDEATSMLNDALSIRVKTLGEHHPAVVATLNSLAVLYSKSGKHKDAERTCKRALEIREHVLGADHPDVAKQLNKIASLYQNLGKYDEVERYCQRSLQIYEKKFGLDDPNVTKTKNNLASCYLRQGKYTEAEILYKQMLTSSHKHDGGSKEDKIKSFWQKKLQSWW